MSNQGKITRKPMSRAEAERRVDNIIASSRLEGLETPSDEREILIKIAMGEIDGEKYIADLITSIKARPASTRRDVYTETPEG